MMSNNEIENERLYDIVNTVGDILYVNNRNQKRTKNKNTYTRSNA